MTLNKATIIGNLGRDPELRHTSNGAAVCNFSVATSEKWKDKQGNTQERTEWHRVIVFGKQGEVAAKYLSKGRQVYIEGRIQYRDWEDKEGNKRTTTEIVASNVVFLKGGNDSGGRQSSPPPPSGGGGYGADFADDDVPFAPLPSLP